MKRHLPVILVCAVLVLGFAGILVVGARDGAGLRSPAFSVGDTKVSQQTVNDQLAWLHGNARLRANLKQQGVQLSDTNSSVNSEVTAQFLTGSIQAEVLRQEAARRGVKASPTAQRLARSQATTQLAGAPKSLVDDQIDLATLTAPLGLSSADAVTNLVKRSARHAHITVDPKYGTWDPQGLVCPPTAPVHCAAATNG